MAVKDMMSKIAVRNVLTATINSNTTTPGAIIDTADFDPGVGFAFAATGFTDGDYSLLIEESDDSGMSGAVTLSEKRLDLDAASVVAAVGAGDYERVSVISNLRYVRASVVSTGVTTGADLNVLFVGGKEISP
jgi:hypothetical protein